MTAMHRYDGSMFRRTARDIMAEGVGIRSRTEDYLRAPARGPSPLAPSLCSGHPMKGAHPLQNPRSNPTPFYLMARDIMAEGVGFEPTVP